MYYVYILQMNSKKYYTGFTDNLKKRFSDHKYSKVSTTKNDLPVYLIWYASFQNKKQALDFETYLKSSSGFAFRNKRLIPCPHSLMDKTAPF